jgi:hypothetical protein
MLGVGGMFGTCWIHYRLLVISLRGQANTTVNAQTASHGLTRILVCGAASDSLHLIKHVLVLNVISTPIDNANLTSFELRVRHSEIYGSINLANVSG